MWHLIPAPIKRAVAWLTAGLALACAVYVAALRQARQAARTDALRGDAKAQERMNEAEIGIGASDADNMRWLRDFHDKHQR